MDDRISKNIHRELRTMNGKLDEMGVVSRILTDSIKEQTAEMKRNARQKTPKIGGLTFPTATSDSITFSKLNTMFVSLQRQVASLGVSPLITIATNGNSSSSNRVVIENTNELASSIAQQLPTSLSQKPAVALAFALCNCSSDKKEEKPKTWLDYIGDAYKLFKDVNSDFTNLRDLSDNIKFGKEMYEKIKKKRGGSKSNGKSESSSGGKDDDPQKDLGQAANGSKNEGEAKDKGNPSNKGKEKENTADSLKTAANGSNKDKNPPPNNAKPNDSKSPPTNAGTDTDQKSSPKPTSNARQDLANAATGSNGEGQAPSPKDTKVDNTKPSPAPKNRRGAGILGRAKKLGKWGGFLAGGAGLAMGLFGGKKDEDGGGEKSESTADDSSNVVQATAETVQSVQSTVGPMADAAKAASTASDVSKAASATKKVGWLGKLLKGARTVSKATRFLRFNPVGFLGGLAVDAGLWAAEKFLLPNDEENPDKESEEDDKSKSAAKMMVRSYMAKNHALAASTGQSNIQSYSPNGEGMQPIVEGSPTGAISSTASMPQHQTPNMPGPTASGSMEVSANSNVTMNLNVNGYIDNRMIEEIKRIAREQYDASFRALERGIADKLPKPKPIPRPQVAEGGMMSH
ncbi:hypothetical protein RQP50_01075 [Paenibacillus sp. chi10]|uniref:Uncharacterized protein n=1 Tax=Paenibacillus suaedae TaxID=3077233 RepID=A0AAJ2JQD4_9BACL|nr:hypothetical protein [Paenibacillus sp. chi10]MDT8974831.1 hypothetical protein [Paenibacillus sp. chi10]